ncbi:hypothetical protein PV327_001191 [Microctonus hyperodae]|uniref:Thyroid transcription factor 1-associated protein 26 n=1 Tax=Microctonus hyperodae TaxID=165561 RepID=A0AA39G8W5_MICHY|nr:hypothetical protein PV327_001191 [Microctonus hyperodae]
MEHECVEMNISPTKANLVDSSKKQFDKKKYRQQKYSNKFKVTTWENERKRILTRELYGSLVCKKKGIFVKASSPEDYFNRINNKEEPQGKRNSVLAARLQYNRRKRELREQKEKELQAKAERHEALENYKTRKAETFKKLSRKTSKGQPVMKDRLELLLAKIQLSK